MIRAAIVDGSGIVTRTLVVEKLEDYPGAVVCPDHVGPGKRIDMPVPPPIPDPQEELYIAIAVASTLEELKNALLGNTGRSGKVAGRAKTE